MAPTVRATATPVHTDENNYNCGEKAEIDGSDATDFTTVFAPGSLASVGAAEPVSGVPVLLPIRENQFTVRKLAAQAMMDVALMMANISQLRTLLSGKATYTPFFHFLMTMVIFSLTSQVVFGILIFIIWVRESEAQQRDEIERQRDHQRDVESDHQECDHRERDLHEPDSVTNNLNLATMVLVFLITIANMFITGFGIDSMDYDNVQPTKPSL